MRSIFTKIVAWSCGTLLLSLLTFFLVTAWLARRPDRERGIVPLLESFELAEARKAFETRGASAAGVFLDSLNSAVAGRHYLVDGRGRDLVTGEDRSALLALLSNNRDEPVSSPQGFLTESTSNDGKYRLIVAMPPPIEIRRFLPYYGLILFAVVLLSWPLAVNIGRPLRILSNAVDRFGQGDFSIRLRLARQDEIGNLARSFDRMADRIETLLVAERQLLQDVSHELRSPLARLSFAAELARTATDRDFAFGKVRKEVARLTELVNTLLEVTRTEGDPSSSLRTSFSLDQLVHDVVNDCRIEFADRTCSVVLLAANPVILVGDRELIRRAIENVVRNAMYYSPAGSTVEIGLTSDSEHARISVRDHGPGIPNELLPNIFQPFFRVDNSRNGATGGLGLGLSIARRAIRLHGGEINAKNAYPGLVVDVDLPSDNALSRTGKYRYNC